MRGDPRTQRGVSPVIAAVFLVAIVVATGAVVAVFAFGVTDTTSTPAPQVVLSTEYEVTGGTIYVTVSHQQGDSLGGDRVIVRGTRSGALPLEPAASYGPNTVIVSNQSVSPSELLVVLYTTSNGEQVVLRREPVPDLVAPSSPTTTPSPTTSGGGGGGSTGGTTPGIGIGSLLVAFLVAAELLARREGLLPGTDPSGDADRSDDGASETDDSATEAIDDAPETGDDATEPTDDGSETGDETTETGSDGSGTNNDTSETDTGS